MTAMETQLALLLNGLRKKELALIEIVNITENQRTVIESGLPLPEIRTMMFEMNKEKQVHIDMVKGCDNMFEAMLKEIGPQLDAQQDMYKPQVAELQTHIRRIMDYDVKVRVAEEQNNVLLSDITPVGPQQQGLTPRAKSLPTDSVKVIQAYEREQNFRKE